MSSNPIPTAVGTDTPDIQELYLAMLRIRLFEDAVLRLFMANEMEGTTHLCQGQDSNLRPAD